MGPWDPAVIGPIAGAAMTAAIAFSVAGVMIFRPLSIRLGDLLQHMQQDKQKRLEEADLVRITDVMERLADRMDRIESRLDFTERVLESGDRNQKRRASATTSGRS